MSNGRLGLLRRSMRAFVHHMETHEPGPPPPPSLPFPALYIYIYIYMYITVSPSLLFLFFPLVVIDRVLRSVHPIAASPRPPTSPSAGVPRQRRVPRMTREAAPLPDVPYEMAWLPSPPLVLSGHAASLALYHLDTTRPSPRTNRTRRAAARRAVRDGLARQRLWRRGPRGAPPRGVSD